MGFESLLRLVKNADPVESGVVNRPLRSLDQNTRYLWELIQSVSLGSTVFAYRQTVEAEAVVGSPVWLNPTALRFERALAVADIDRVTGSVTAADSSQVWGVVYKKISSTLADVLLYGLATLNVSAAADGNGVTPGLYYLSGAAPGRLVRQRPPVSVAVLRVVGDGRVFVMPQFVDALDRHTHYKFSLVCLPAGLHEQPEPGERHVIDDADAGRQGWLPAGHPVFSGNAPAGAVFGYNLSAHTALANVWPPLPLGQAALEWDKGADPAVGGTAVPLGRDGLVTLDRFGIWWMSDCYSDVPWPYDYDNTTDDSASSSNSAAPECPRKLAMSLVLWFSKTTFLTDTPAVLSLRSGDDRIRVVCSGTTTPASSGNLELFLDLNLTVDDNVAGHLALKEFDPATSKFKRGPVCEGLVSGSANVVLSSDSTQVVGEDTVYQGQVSVMVVPEDSLELDVQLVRLDGAEEEHFQNLLYLGFIPEEERSYRAKVYVPAGLSLANPKMKLRFWILGRAAGTLPQLVFSGRRVPRPAAGLAGPEDLPLEAEEFSIACNTQGVLASTNQYVESESTAFDVAPGDTVFFSVTREDDDGYAAEVGVLRQVGVVEAG